MRNADSPGFDSGQSAILIKEDAFQKAGRSCPPDLGRSRNPRTAERWLAQVLTSLPSHSSCELTQPQVLPLLQIPPLPPKYSRVCDENEIKFILISILRIVLNNSQNNVK